MIAPLLIALATLGAVPAHRPHAVQPQGSFTLVVDGTVRAVHRPLIVRDGRILVPVRAFVTALGLDAQRQGHTITMHAGARTLVLIDGDAIAYIDGRAVGLRPAPSRIGGALYAPLRFFTRAFGAQAVFDRHAQKIRIESPLIGLTENEVFARGKTLVAQGTVTATDLTSDPPTVTLSYGDVVRTFPFAPNAEITAHDAVQDVSVPAELSQVHPGDFAVAVLGKDRRTITALTDIFGSRIGRIVAVAPRAVVLNDGHVVAPNRETVISLDGFPVPLQELRPGDGVTVRYNVETGVVAEIAANRPLRQAPALGAPVRIDAVRTSAKRPVRAGTVIRIELRGTPGGAATAAIGSFVRGIPLPEQSPGLYVGTWRIPKGANIVGVPIVGHLQKDGTAATPVQAPQALWASAEPPGIAEIAPAPHAIVTLHRPGIYAVFVPGAVPIVPESERLWINGHDVSALASRTPHFIAYRPELGYAPGRIEVTVQVADEAGNVNRKSWTFRIAAPQPGERGRQTVHQRGARAKASVNGRRR